jgi:transcriptional regulator NrdR family protein
VQNIHQPKLEVLFEKAEIVAVKPKDNREKIDIATLNAEITKTVEKINTLRADIDEIINEIKA